MPIDAYSPGSSIAENRRSRGRLMLTAEIRREIFHNAVSEWWIRRNVAPTKRMRLGHSTVAWYEADVLEWLDSRPNR